MVESHAKNGAWPAHAKAYKLITAIGMGSFGLVWKAQCIEGSFASRVVAIKVVDLEQFQDNSIEEIRKEISIMSTCFHKNVVSCYVSFIEDSDLWLVMPVLGAGSCLDVMKVNCPGGIKNEAVIATIMRETLLGLQYFHENGQIHRDIKAGNILMDLDGNVYLSDFGVSASLKKGQKRKTFVGSPCWMAPEVMEQVGHDFSADIWSLGITAIELAEGEAPYCNLPAMKVLVNIINKPPPSLASTGKWEQCFRDVITACLQKDPSKRPSIEDLLKNHKKFFAKARGPEYLKANFIGDLPEVHLRRDPQLDSLGQEFLEKMRMPNKGKKSVKAKKNDICWDFEESEEKPLAAQEKAKPQAKKEHSKKPKQKTDNQPIEDDGLFDDL